MEKKQAVNPISDAEIVLLYKQGLTIDMLANKVKNSDHGKERWGTVKSRNYVRQVIYEEHMRVKRENEMRRRESKG